MTLLWEKGTALSRAEIVTQSTNKNWNDKSIHILLNSLLKKGALKVDGFVRTGKNYGRTYAAAVSPEEYAAMQALKGYPESLKEQTYLPKLFSALINYPNTINSDDIDSLYEILNQKKKELSEKEE